MPTGSRRIRKALRVASASYWTALAAFVVLTALHLRWLHRSSHAGDVLSAYGAGLVAIGVLVGSRPYIRAGIAGMIEAALPDGGAGPFGGPLYDASVKALRDTARAQVTRDVLAERVVAVGVVLAGTLLNGWGTPLARRWGWPV